MPEREAADAKFSVTSRLWSIPAHAPDLDAEIAAMRRLADTMENAPGEILPVCAEIGLELCQAGSCGISIAEQGPDGEACFRWVTIAGELKNHTLGIAPKASPCGVCVETNLPLLLERPDLVYPFLAMDKPIHKSLIVPLAGKDSPVRGTIWVVSHDPARTFDSTHVRLIQRLAVFTASALQMAMVAQKAVAIAREKELAFTELDHRIGNTLQLAASLLQIQLQKGGVADPAARAALETARRRMISIGQAHRIGSGPEAGNLAALVRGVCADIAGLNPAIRVELDAPSSMAAPSGDAAVVALIVNELVTNALKHAFEEGHGGAIHVRLQPADAGQAELCVSDDGRIPIALPAGRGIGMKLVQGLAQQLGGTFAIEADFKRFTVRFPLAAASGHDARSAA